MRAFILGVILFFSFPFCFSINADVWVNSYVRKDGTFVQGHWRSDPDGILENNYSYDGNVNPYTGKVGNVKSYNRRAGSNAQKQNTEGKTDELKEKLEQELGGVFSLEEAKRIKFGLESGELVWKKDFESKLENQYILFWISRHYTTKEIFIGLIIAYLVITAILLSITNRIKNILKKHGR